MSKMRLLGFFNLHSPLLCLYFLQTCCWFVVNGFNLYKQVINPQFLIRIWSGSLLFYCYFLIPGKHLRKNRFSLKITFLNMHFCARGITVAQKSAGRTVLKLCFAFISLEQCLAFRTENNRFIWYKCNVLKTQEKVWKSCLQCSNKHTGDTSCRYVLNRVYRADRFFRKFEDIGLFQSQNLFSLFI